MVLFYVAVASQYLLVVLIVGLLCGFVGGTVAIAIERARPYAVGFLISLGTVVVVGGGACVALIASLGTLG